MILQPAPSLSPHSSPFTSKHYHSTENIQKKNLKQIILKMVESRVTPPKGAYSSKDVDYRKWNNYCG